MRRREHWLESAERVNGPGLRLIGEDDLGYLYVPSRHREDWWDRRLNLRNPAHWPFYLRSRLTRQVVWLEVYP